MVVPRFCVEMIFLNSILYKLLTIIIRIAFPSKYASKFIEQITDDIVHAKMTNDTKS
jgi:hypothetical protein